MFKLLYYEYFFGLIMRLNIEFKYKCEWYETILLCHLNRTKFEG